MVWTINEIDGTTDRTMLVVEAAADGGGVDVSGTDMIGDGTSAITTCVGAGHLNELEADGVAPYIMNHGDSGLE